MIKQVKLFNLPITPNANVKYRSITVASIVVFSFSIILNFSIREAGHHYI